MTKLFSFFKKPIESVSDEITTKFKTPFFSTFIIVWILANNKFIYDLFFNSMIKDKTIVLSSQFNIGEWSFYSRNLKLIGVTLLVVLLYYIIINISRIITMISEERIKINLLASLKSKTISTKDDVEFWKKRADNFNRKNRELQSELSVVRASSDTYKNKLKKADEELDQIIKNGKSHINRMQNILSSGLNNINNTDVPNDIDIKRLKEKFDAEFKLYDEGLKPKFPSFIVG